MDISAETEPKQTGDIGLNGLSQHKEFLLDFIDPDFGLLDKLLGCRALKSREINRIRSKETVEDKNEELLRQIAKDHKFDLLFVCLKESRQEHIVKYLRENGVYKTEFGGCWPLLEDEISTLDINREFLVDQLENGDLVQRMFAKKVLNNRQKDFIVSKSANHEKNEALLDILRRRSRGDFLETIKCLRDSNQSHIAKILETKAAVVSLHVNLDSTVTNIVQAEEDIATQIAALLRDKSSDESKQIMDSILELVDAKLVGSNVGHSVVLHFLCTEIAHLIQLRHTWTSGVLTKLTEQLFNLFEVTSNKFSVTVRWDEKEYCNTKTYLEGLEELRNSKSSHQTRLLELDFEVQEMILERVCLHYLTTKHLRDSEVFISISGVVFCWLQILTRRKFISQLFRRLRAYSRSHNKRSLIIRNNQELLSELIQPKNLLGPLRSSDCLTDQQHQCINRRRRHHTTASTDLLHGIRSLDGKRFSALVGCFRQRELGTAADILESGGVTLKTTVVLEKVKNRPLLERKMVERFQEIRRSDFPLTRETESCLKRLKSRGTEIVLATHDRTIILWIHCHSPDAYTDMTKPEIASRHLENISDAFGKLTVTAIKTRILHVEGSTLDKEFVTCTTKVTFAGKLLLTAEYFYGITTLDEHIYVLCQSPNSLNVFQDVPPFQLIEVLPLDGIQRPEDIGSSTKDACLYVTDSGKKCLWRKTREELTVWLTGIDWPFTVSVMRDGRILLPRKGQPSHVELYSREGTLVQRIQLPNDIIDPLHGVQTRRGNLVISHWWRDSVTEGVFELNRDGQVVRHFLTIGPDQHLTYPRYLAIDTGDRIFVTDFDYNRVIQLDVELGWVRTLLSKEVNCIEYPERLHFNAHRNQLLVGHSEGVEVYQLESS